MPANTFNTWNSKTNFVDEASLKDPNTGLYGNAIQSESCFICVGPPNIEGGIKPGELIGVGRVSSFQVNQSKNVQPNFEIGSNKKFFIPGYVMTQGSIAQITFNGPNLLKALYLYGYQDEDGIVTDSSLVGEDAPGYGNYWINLASSLFNKPFGMGMIMTDSEYNSVNNGTSPTDRSNLYGGFYMPNTFITNHSFGLSAGQLVISENVSFLCDKIYPLKFT